MTWRLSLPLLALLASAAPALAAEPDLPFARVALSATEVRLGEVFHVFIDVPHAPDTQVNLPASLPLGADFEERERESARSSEPDGRVTEHFEITVMAFALGELEFPSIPLTYAAAGKVYQIRTEPVRVRVLSVVADGDEALRDIAPPLEVEARDWTLVYAAAGAAIAVLAAALALLVSRLARRRRRRGGAAVPSARGPTVPADQEALARLDALEASGALDTVDLKPAYHEMSEIFRQYLGRRFGFPALDLTTEEIRAQLRLRPDGREVEGPVLEWLGECDLVKFANFAVTADEGRQALYELRQLIEEIRRMTPSGGAGAPAQAAASSAEEKVA